MDDGCFSKLDEEWTIARVWLRGQDRRGRASRRECRLYVREKLLLEFGSDWIAAGLSRLTHARVVWIVDRRVVTGIEIRVAIVVFLVAIVEVVGSVRLPRPRFAALLRFIWRGVEERVAQER